MEGIMPKLEITNHTNKDGNPAGGSVLGTGISIIWQDGPLGRGEDRKEPNGAFVEDILEACLARLRFYQEGKFPSQYNNRAITHVKTAIRELNNRTEDRERREVEGTHKT